MVGEMRCLGVVLQSVNEFPRQTGQSADSGVDGLSVREGSVESCEAAETGIGGAIKAVPQLSINCTSCRRVRTESRRGNRRPV